jgi:hypothetical protein
MVGARAMNYFDSDNEDDYIDDYNREFNRWSRRKKRKHVKNLWRKAYVKADGVVMFNNLNSWITSKLKLYGGHMLNYQSVIIESDRATKRWFIIDP